MVEALAREAVITEIGELFQRLANGGSINSLELAAMHQHIAMSLSDPHAPATAYYCRAKLRDGSTCTAELCQTTAPYGRTLLRCPVCHKIQTIFFGGYRKFSDSPINKSSDGSQ